MNPQVTYNLSRIKEILPLSLDKSGSYRLLFNRVTGEMHFADKQPLSRAWRSARLVVQPGHRPSFHLYEEGGEILSRNGIKIAAWKVACEMLAILNTLGILPEESLAAQNSVEELKQWAGQIDRIEAERKLANLPIGSYLIRGENALEEEIASRLSESNNILVHAYIVTYVAKKNKIAEACMLETEHGWTLYKDDPNLSSNYTFDPTPKALLSRLPLIQ